MKTQTTTIGADALFHFHVGRGGRFFNPGHVEFVGHGRTAMAVIPEFADVLPSWERTAYDEEIEDSLIESAVAAWSNKDWDDEDLIRVALALNLTEDEIREEAFLPFNSNQFVDGAIYGNGTGYLDIDGDYNRHYVAHAAQCSESELLIALESLNQHNGLNSYYSHIRDYCREIAEVEEFNEVLDYIDSL